MDKEEIQEALAHTNTKISAIEDYLRDLQFTKQCLLAVLEKEGDEG